MVEQERSAATRERLVDAAVHLVLNEGPSAMTTRRVLEVAGLSKGALYHHFASKDELYEAIAERFVALDDAPSEHDPVEAHARSIEESFAPNVGTLLGRMRAEALDNEQVRQVLRRYDAQVVEQYGALNQRSIDDGLFRQATDPEALVEMISVFIDGLDLRMSTGFATDRARVVTAFVNAIADAVVDPSHPDAETLIERFRAVGQP